LRIYTSQDPQGLEVAGALKNVIAIAAGAAAGLGYQANTSAALITRGLNEMLHIGLSQGGDPMTFLGLGGVGDLLLTCGSSESRNYRVGKRLGEGASVTEAIAGAGSVAEGVYTAQAAQRWVNQANLTCPIIEQIHAVLTEKITIASAVQQLLARPSTSELTAEQLVQAFSQNKQG
jgi:glycerol-3-phosphate dehydrogenase